MNRKCAHVRALGDNVEVPDTLSNPQQTGATHTPLYGARKKTLLELNYTDAAGNTKQRDW
jgi:hypothetical protein